MAAGRVFISSLRAWPYRVAMELRKQSAPSQDERSARQAAAERYDGMSYWRWLLFAALARFELREDIYLRMPNAKMVPHVVSVDISGRGPTAGSSKTAVERIGTSSTPADYYAATDARFVSQPVLGRIWQVIRKPLAALAGCRR